MEGDKKKISKREEHQKVYDIIKIPAILYAVGAGLYAAFLPKGEWIWFSWHPLSMMVGAVGITCNAVLLKKVGGLENTRMHGNMLFASVIMMLFGVYVIYTNKDMMGKPHFQTWHSWMGLASMCGFMGSSILATILIHPDYGFAKTNKIFRMFHRYGSRLGILLAWAACMTGFMTMQNSVPHQVGFGIPLVLVAYIAIIR